MDFSSINPLAALLAVLFAFGLGALWYGPLFGKAWQRLSGLTDEALAEANMARTFSVAFLLQAVAIGVLAAVLGPEATVSTGAGTGLVVGVAWVATALGVTFVFSQMPLALFAIDAGYHVAYYTLAGGIVGMF